LTAFGKFAGSQFLLFSIISYLSCLLNNQG
jgi:hypothetical protein